MSAAFLGRPVLFQVRNHSDGAVRGSYHEPAPERLLDDVERIGEFVEFDHPLAAEPQQVDHAKAEHALGGALNECHVRHHGSAIILHDHDLRLAALERVVAAKLPCRQPA